MIYRSLDQLIDDINRAPGGNPLGLMSAPAKKHILCRVCDDEGWVQHIDRFGGSCLRLEHLTPCPCTPAGEFLLALQRLRLNPQASPTPKPASRIDRVAPSGGVSGQLR